MIITDPGYFHFESSILMSGGVVVRIPLSYKNGFRMHPDDVSAYITPKTKAIIVCDPLNPFGTVQTKEELLSIIEIARSSDIIIINDITHNTQRIDPASQHYCMSSLFNETNVDNVISTFSVSHGYGMAVVRIGFLAGHVGLMAHALTANTFIIIRIMEPYWFLAAMVMMIPKLEQKQEIAVAQKNIPDEREVKNTPAAEPIVDKKKTGLRNSEFLLKYLL